VTLVRRLEFCLRFARTERYGDIDAPLTTLRISSDSIHRVDAVRGRTATIARFLSERARVRGDREALTAIRGGVAHQRKHIGWYSADTGRSAEAGRNYLRGFREVGDATLLLRALAVWVRPWAGAAHDVGRHDRGVVASTVAMRDAG